ncbi:hypothetical protein B7P43_G06719, partial [Cryptotermes secundus]
RKFRGKFRDERVPSRQSIHNLMNKLTSTGLLTDRKQKYERRVLTEEKLDDIGARLEHTPRKSLKRLAQETEVSKSSKRKKINSLRSCFRKELKRVKNSQKSGNGTDDNFTPSLWY